MHAEYNNARRGTKQIPCVKVQCNETAVLHLLPGVSKHGTNNALYRRVRDINFSSAARRAALRGV